MAKKGSTPKNRKPSGRVDRHGRSLDNRGRPSTYDKEFHPQAAKALCSKGATIAELDLTLKPARSRSRAKPALSLAALH
jgi:hypothetical protein